jgi:hypothetical protein
MVTGFRCELRFFYSFGEGKQNGIPNSLRSVDFLDECAFFIRDGVGDQDVILFEVNKKS